MVAILEPMMQRWLPEGKRLFATVKFAPFRVEASVCVCHGYTWWDDQRHDKLVRLTWDS